jgi:hypothetical protein
VSIPDVPQFDDVVVKTLAKVLGFLSISGGGIVALVALVFAVESWHSGVRGSVRIACQVTRTLRAAGSHLVDLPPMHRAGAVLVIVFVGLGQVLVVGLCFLGGNYVSLVTNGDRRRIAAETLDNDPSNLLHPTAVAKILSVDLISAGYIVLAAGVIIQSYRWALSKHPMLDDKLDVLGAIMAWPAVILGSLIAIFSAILLVVLLLGLALNLLFTGGDTGDLLRQDAQLAVPYVLGFVICGIYSLSCKAAVYGAALVARVWPSTATGW